MLSAIFASIGGAFIDKLFGGVLDIAKQVINKQITEIEAKTKFAALVTDAVKAIEVSHADALTKTFATFWTAASDDKSGLMKRMWAVALGSQIFVLFWSQWVVPLLYAYGYMDKGWHAGTSAEWAYLLVGALLGLGPLVLRSGPGALDTNKLKGLIGK